MLRTACVDRCTQVECGVASQTCDAQLSQIRRAKARFKFEEDAGPALGKPFAVGTIDLNVTERADTSA